MGGKEGKDVENGLSGDRMSKKASFFIGDDKEQVPIRIIGPDDEEIDPNHIVVPPDGGWGWVVCMASFLSNVIVDGIIFSFGLMQDSIKKSFEEDGATSDNLTTQIAWIGSLQSGFYLFGGPFVSALANKYGFRVVAILGAIVGAAGFLGSFLVCQDRPSLYGMFALYGVVGGIGFNLLYVPSVIAVGFYFEKYRALATGIAVCGSGVGTFVFAPLTNYLVTNHGWKYTLLAQAAITLSCVFCGAMYRPVKPVPVTPAHPKSGSSDPEKKLISPYPSPAGTPLLMRIKRAREMEKWDSINSVEHDGNMTETELQEALVQRKGSLISTHSLTTNPVPIQKQTKRLSVPTMSMATDAGRLVVPVLPVRNKTAVGELVEIQEETDDASEEDALKKSDANKKEDNTKAQSQVQPSRLPGSKRGSRLSTEEGAFLTARNSVAELRIGTSTYRIDELSGSRILRVNSKVLLNKPMYRDDVFYTGSMRRIPEYASTVEKGMITSREWSAIVTNKPMDRRDSEKLPTQQQKLNCLLKKLTFINKILDISLLGSPTFILLAASSAITMLGFFVPFMYLKGLAMQNSVSKDQVPFLIATIGGANTVGRILCGWLADRPEVNAVLVNNIALTVCGAVTALAPFLNSYPLFLGYALMFGLGTACFASLRSILIVELLGLGKLTNAFGLLCLFQGISAMCGSPLAGFLFDQSGKYDLTFFVTGGLILFSGVLCYPLSMVNNWEKKKEEEEDAN